MRTLAEAANAVRRASADDFAVLAKLIAAARGDVVQARAMATSTDSSRAPASTAVQNVLKAAVTAGGLDDFGLLLANPTYRLMASAFVEALRPLTILGRLTGYRSVPTQVKVPRQTAGSEPSWVGERKPIPVKRLDFDSFELDDHKLAGIVVSTLELATLARPDATGLIKNDLLAGVAAMMDRALLDPTAAATAASPASVTYGAQQIVSAGTSAENAVSDVNRLIEALYGSNLVSPHLVTTPRVAARMATLRLASGGGYAFPSLGARGGEILGIPVITSASVPESDSSPQTGSIVLIDAAELIVADGSAIFLDTSTQANLQLDGAPDDPADASTVFESLWQKNLVGWRVVRPINWAMRRSGCVATLTGVSY